MRCDALTRTTTTTTTLRWRWSWRSTALCRYISHSVFESKSKTLPGCLVIKRSSGRLDISICKQTRIAAAALSAAGSRSSRQQAAEVRGGRRQDTTSRKQHAADMQICKSRRVDNFQPNQICNCSSMFPSRLHACSPSPSFICPCHTNFVNLYLPRAAHTNNPRNRLEATMLPATSNYKKLL